MIRWRKFQVGAGKGRAGFLGLQKQALTTIGNVGAGEDDLQSVLVEADSLYKNGQAIRVRAWGRSANNGNDKTLRLYAGATKIFDSGVLVLTNKPWFLEAIVLRTATDVQLAFAHGLAASAVLDPTRTALALDDGASITFKVTGEATATDDIQCDYMEAVVETV
mgnify:CR=1 FL=1